MNIRRYLIVGALALLGAGCATVTKDIKVDAETRAGADPTGYRTYAWVGTAVGDIQEKPSVETARRRLDYAVAKMFQTISQDQAKPRMGYY